MAVKVSARERARVAKAERDAKRRLHDKSVMEETQNFYKAEDAAEVARAALDQAELDRATAVSALAELGETVADIATLCGISASDVRALKKIARATSDPGETESATEPADTATAVDAAKGDAA